MKKILLTVALLLTTVFANEGKELHEESCVACHIVHHDDAFYTRKDRKVASLSKLGGQVSRCNQAFSGGWFPDEEELVVNYLNTQYYKFKKITALESNSSTKKVY